MRIEISRQAQGVLLGIFLIITGILTSAAGASPWQPVWVEDVPSFPSKRYKVEEFRQNVEPKIQWRSTLIKGESGIYDYEVEFRNESSEDIGFNFWFGGLQEEISALSNACASVVSGRTATFRVKNIESFQGFSILLIKRIRLGSDIASKGKYVGEKEK